MKSNRDTVDLASALADQGKYRQAFRLLLNAGRRGDTAVFLNLGYAYDVGQGIRSSKAKALYWYRRALKEGQAAAAHNIATVYRDRDNVIKAIRWLARAVAFGDSGSNLELGQILMARLGQLREALDCFRAVGPYESEADIEAARTWVAVVEGMLATERAS